MTSCPQQLLHALVPFLTQYIDRKAPTPSVKVVIVTQTRHAKRQKTSISCGIFKGKIKLRKYSQEEYDSMSAAQHHQLYELWKRAGLIKGNKTAESSRAIEARVAALEAKIDNSSDLSLFTDIDKPKPSNHFLLPLGKLLPIQSLWHILVYICCPL